MENIEELKKTAESLRKQNKLTEAIAIYEKLWLEHRDSCNEWVGWGYAFSLRKMKNPSLAFQVAQQVYEKWKDFAPNNGVLAWCLYDLVINKDSEEIKKNESDYFQAASRILALVPQDKFSAYAKTVFKVIEYLEETRNILPAADINTWLDRLDKSKLSTETWEGKDDKGRPMTHASDLEKWYAKKCKAYYELKRFQDCIDTGQEAFSTLSAFHYHYDKWIRRDMGRSYGEVGNPKEGITLFEKFMDDRSEYFIYFEAATLYFQNNEIEKSLKYLAQSALVRHELEHKVNLFAFIGKVLLQKGEKDLAYQHILLSAKIRAEKDWKAPGDLQSLLEEAGMDVNTSPSSRDLERSLEKYWQSLMYSEKRQDIGTIKTIVPPGKSGFIATGGNQEYYFRMNEFRGNSASLKPGMKVSFYITPSTEPGKRDTAVNITLVKE